MQLSPMPGYTLWFCCCCCCCCWYCCCCRTIFILYSFAAETVNSATICKTIRNIRFVIVHPRFFVVRRHRPIWVHTIRSKKQQVLRRIGHTFYQTLSSPCYQSVLLCQQIPRTENGRQPNHSSWTSPSWFDAAVSGFVPWPYPTIRSYSSQEHSRYNLATHMNVEIREEAIRPSKQKRNWTHPTNSRELLNIFYLLLNS